MIELHVHVHVCSTVCVVCLSARVRSYVIHMNGFWYIRTAKVKMSSCLNYPCSYTINPCLPSPYCHHFLKHDFCVFDTQNLMLITRTSSSYTCYTWRVSCVSNLTEKSVHSQLHGINWGARARERSSTPS